MTQGRKRTCLMSHSKLLAESDITEKASDCGSLDVDLGLSCVAYGKFLPSLSLAPPSVSLGL